MTTLDTFMQEQADEGGNSRFQGRIHYEQFSRAQALQALLAVYMAQGGNVDERLDHFLGVARGAALPALDGAAQDALDLEIELEEAEAEYSLVLSLMEAEEAALEEECARLEEEGLAHVAYLRERQQQLRREREQLQARFEERQQQLSHLVQQSLLRQMTELQQRMAKEVDPMAQGQQAGQHASREQGAALPQVQIQSREFQQSHQQMRRAGQEEGLNAQPQKQQEVSRQADRKQPAQEHASVASRMPGKDLQQQRAPQEAGMEANRQAPLTRFKEVSNVTVLHQRAPMEQASRLQPGREAQLAAQQQRPAQDTAQNSQRQQQRQPEPGIQQQSQQRFQSMQRELGQLQERMLATQKRMEGTLQNRHMHNAITAAQREMDATQRRGRDNDPHQAVQREAQRLTQQSRANELQQSRMNQAQEQLRNVQERIQRLQTLQNQNTQGQNAERGARDAERLSRLQGIEARLSQRLASMEIQSIRMQQTQQSMRQAQERTNQPRPGDEAARLQQMQRAQQRPRGDESALQIQRDLQQRQGQNAQQAAVESGKIIQISAYLNRQNAATQNPGEQAAATSRIPQLISFMDAVQRRFPTLPFPGTVTQFSGLTDKEAGLRALESITLRPQLAVETGRTVTQWSGLDDKETGLRALEAMQHRMDRQTHYEKPQEYRPEQSLAAAKPETKPSFEVGKSGCHPCHGPCGGCGSKAETVSSQVQSGFTTANPPAYTPYTPPVTPFLDSAPSYAAVQPVVNYNQLDPNARGLFNAGTINLGQIASQIPAILASSQPETNQILAAQAQQQANTAAVAGGVVSGTNGMVIGGLPLDANARTVNLHEMRAVQQGQSAAAGMLA
ncbi:MAG: hypothetical protein J0L97_03215 [Alphaproteobacteria bacterium]|nr:hypothetical protein [Alphaproteobacteria bacterium]